MKTLGILGGIGPESTGEFYLELIRRYQEVFRPKSNTEYPHIYINSIPAPDLIDTEEDSTILEPYRNGLRQLERSGADMVVMACNSAYCFIESLEKSVSIPILRPRDAVESALKRGCVTKICVIASPTTTRCGLYAFDDIELLRYSASDISVIGSAITKYNLGMLSGEHIDAVIALATVSCQNGYTIIAGCTEIHAILKHADIEHIDPMQETIEVILDQWQSRATLQKQSSFKHGVGIFTRQAIVKGETFYTVPMNFTSKIPIPHWAHVSGVWFCDESVVNWVNHSCEPNTAIDVIDGKLSLRSLRDIGEGEEIVCDYDVTEVGGIDVSCTCGSENCRRVFKRIE